MNPFTEIARAAAASTDKHLSTISSTDTLHMIALASILVSVGGETKLRARRDAIEASILAKLPQFPRDVVEAAVDAAEIEASLSTGAAILDTLGRVPDRQQRSLINLAVVAVATNGGVLRIGEKEALDLIRHALTAPGLAR